MMFFYKFRFGTFLGLAHAAMTAEGDNSVLMQKVAKERLGILAKQPLQAGFRIRIRIRMDPH
jgi:hypothetical protein